MRILFICLTSFFVITSFAGAVEKPPAKVVVSQITTDKIARFQTFIGLLYYERVSRVSSEVAGLVKKIDVKTGDRIRKNEPLVWLDIETLEKEIQIQKNMIEQADLRISHLKKNHDRMERLLKNDNIREKDYDDAVFEYQSSLLERQAALTTLEKLLIRKRKRRRGR